jgi:fatty acid desaturase
MASQPTSDSVRRAIEDKEIADAGVGCLGVVLFLVCGVVFALLAATAGFWVGAIAALVIFIVGIAILAGRRYPR